MAAFFKSVDVAVMGRKTYDKMRELAPQQASFPGMENYVFSTSTKERDGEVKFIFMDVREWVMEMRSRPGKDIWLMGGGNLVRQFLVSKVVDEIVLTIHPRLLGMGIPLFPTPYPEIELELLRCEQYSLGWCRCSTA